MTSYVALLRAVNLGGHNKLPMSDLKALCERAGFAGVRTYIASGNVVFTADADERAVKATLENELDRFTGKRIEVLVRTGEEMAAVLAANPFPSCRIDRTVAVFLNAPPPSDALNHVTGLREEEVALGKREIYVHYGEGMGTSRLKIKAAAAGTARNIKTVATLAVMASPSGVPNA